MKLFLFLIFGATFLTIGQGALKCYEQLRNDSIFVLETAKIRICPKDVLCVTGRIVLTNGTMYVRRYCDDSKWRLVDSSRDRVHEVCMEIYYCNTDLCNGFKNWNDCHSTGTTISLSYIAFIISSVAFSINYY